MRLFIVLAKFVVKADNRFVLVKVVCAVLFSSLFGAKAVTTINFTLDEPCKTSCGIYTTNGVLVRTLWSNIRYYKAGTYSATWDEKDDSGNSVSAGIYAVKILQNNLLYVWDGALGNTSEDRFGLGVHTGFDCIKDMAISGTNAFYCSGYNEGKYSQRMFYTTEPQRVQNQWTFDQYVNGNPTTQNMPGLANRYWWFMAADTSVVYCAAQSCYDWTNNLTFGYPGCIVATRISDQTEFNFSSGTTITNTTDQFPNGIYVGTQPGISGLAVQIYSNVLAASVYSDNKIYLFNKTTGAALSPSSISLNAPGRMNFSINGDLWVVNSNSVVCYANMNSTPAVRLILTNGLVSPLAVAVSPVNPNLVIVADGGSSQQLKGFDTNGTSLWIYGQAGGYQSNGPAVQNNKFWFTSGGTNQTFLSFASDGSFWVEDGGNFRTLHFDSSRNYLDQIMYQPHSYSATVDKANPSRVFSGFLEFRVDYTKPLCDGWTLVNNWRANIDTNHLASTDGSRAFYSVQTFTNGRTYALIDNLAYNTFSGSRAKELCELTTNGLRFTGIFPATNSLSINNSFGTSGAALASYTRGNSWWSSPLKGFDAANNPIWGKQTLIATAPTQWMDPKNNNIESFKTTAITSNNVVVCFDDSTRTNYHLGGIALNGSNFLWKASPAVPYFDGQGGYEISNGVNYAGSDVQAIDGHIVFGYHGEFFRSQGQAGQHLHFYDDGLFIGQYGESYIGYPAVWLVPAFVGNGYGPVLVKTNGEYYSYENDENGHGPQRWHLVNAANVREMSGNVVMGGSIALTNQPVDFPVAVSAIAGDQTVLVSWSAVAGADGYKVYYSTNNGGPYSVLVGDTASTGYNTTDLTNGVTYYFVVSAVIGGNEFAHSEQSAATPFNSSKSVMAAGHQISNLCINKITYGNGRYYPPGTMAIEVNSNAPALGIPSFVNSVHLANTLTLEDEDGYGFGSLINEKVGTKGYVLFDWGGIGNNASTLATNIVVTVRAGWEHGSYFMRQFYINGQQGINPAHPGYGVGLAANPTGVIDIGIGDTNYHFLTVVSGAIGGGPRSFVISLVSTNGDSASYICDDSLSPRPNSRPQSNHIFQFIFKGNSTLTVSNTDLGNGAVQALFFDDVAPLPGLAPAPPKNLRIIAP